MSNTQSNLHSFAEESCFSGEEFRQKRNTVVFRVSTFRSIAGLGGFDGGFVFYADNAIFYDPEDTFLVDHLTHAQPEVDWRALVFVKVRGRSKVDVYDPLDDELVASITVRGAEGSVTSGEIVGGDVASMSQWREKLRPARETQEILDPHAD